MANVAFEALVTQVWVMIEVDMTEATVMEVSWCGRKEVVEMVRELNVMVDENENAREGRYERYLQLRRARRPNILDRIALRVCISLHRISWRCRACQSRRWMFSLPCGGLCGKDNMER